MEGFDKGGVIERIISENDIGKKEFYERIKKLITEELEALSEDCDLVSKRYERFRRMGAPKISDSPRDM